MKDLPKFSKLSDKEVVKILKQNNVALTVEEARKVEKTLGRPLTLTEAILFGIQGSEHCSYKSSRKYLKLLPTKGPNVILGPGEDSGIVEIVKDGKEKYGLVVSHESHNHPSQIVPYEGAATGVGGCVRDVACMGAQVIATMDPLRFGDIKKKEVQQITDGVVGGIGGYGNPIGVPNIGGDAYFDEQFNDNCLVNVVALGVIKESAIIHSYVPKKAAKEKWDIIIVGKPTDNSGMGGASFASFQLDEEEKEKNKGAVQEPNPFLKRHLLVSSYDLFKTLQKKKLISKVSFKDMGAGGITCSTVEQVAKSGLGADIDLGKVNVAIENLPPSVIACAETQERFAWMCHPSLTRMIVEHYNKKWDLPSVSENARACVVGKVTEGNYILRYRGQTYVDAPSAFITEGLLYDREYNTPKSNFKEPKISEPKEYNEIILKLLASENIACRKPIYERYDKQVQGHVVIEAGEADAGVILPLFNEEASKKAKKVGMAFSTDSNPRYALIDPFHGAANSVIESMRNVAAVGAYPQAITDCLNYGNPEKPEQMWELKRGIEGIAAACNGIKLWNYPKSPTPVISGNVSLYNESKNGHVPPSAVICCLGKINDASKAITLQLKEAGNILYLLGERKNELGGSEYYRQLGYLGANVPQEDLQEATKQIYALVEGVENGLINAAHDISEGGLAITIAEMCIGGRGEGQIGVRINTDKIEGSNLRTDQKLFSQTGGFVVEISRKNQKKFLELCRKLKLKTYEIGQTIKQPQLVFQKESHNIANLPLTKVSNQWLNGLREKL